ncbi:craniofacial development protein 2 [Biomphalaria pfeifferi]|uniref:Craniofacial development protein 2 n=1 Tax=Biomphalaria pfeifferi TaxID=112525 RepID=A0AAD8C9K9_BIOPF|nr:craniofacial development protein 2 [Biomphalaria pfeifferi]
MATQDPPILTLKERHKLIFGTWNVTSFNKYENAILNELEKYDVDIVCIQETKYEEGTIKIGDYMLVTKCYEKDMIYGLGFMIKKTLYKYIEIEEDQTERICFLKLRTDAGIVHIINVYFPQNDSEVEKKEDCFLALQDKLLDISEDKIVFILGDFNSHIGSDNLAWFRCLGEHGIPCEVNDNGLRLLEFCTFYDLGITHSFFDQRGNAQNTFQSKLNKSKSYIDFCITRNKHRQFVKMTKANLPSQTSMDHLLVTSDIELSFSLNEDKTLSKSQFLLVSTFVILSCRSQHKNDDVEEKWQEIKKKLFGTESHDQLYEENFSKFQKQLEEISFIYNSVLKKNNNGRMTETEMLGFGCVIKEIVKNYEDDSIENIKIPEQTMLDLLNSAINEEMASNVDDTDVLFQDLPTVEEIEKLFKYFEGQIDVKAILRPNTEAILRPNNEAILRPNNEAILRNVKAILRPNVLILQQLYELCYTSEYIPLELSFVEIYFWHRDAKAHCCSMDNILFDLSWSLVNECLIESTFEDLPK